MPTISTRALKDAITAFERLAEEIDDANGWKPAGVEPGSAARVKADNARAGLERALAKRPRPSKASRYETVDELCARVASGGYYDKPKRPRPIRASRKSAAQRKQTSTVYEAVAKRAGMTLVGTVWVGGLCECGCGMPLCHGDLVAKPELDHARGKKNAPESVKNCWMLRADCHRLKHRGPAREWLAKYIAHSEKHGNLGEACWAGDRLADLDAGKFPKSERAREGGR